MKLKVITATSTSTIQASDALFARPANPTLLAQAIRVYLSNVRQGTSKAQTRSQVSRSKAKWYRQKGTGNARHGSRNAPIFVGGGVAHGPTGLENWTKNLNQKMKAQALQVALSAQVENIVVTENLSSLKGKTAEAAKLVQKMLGETQKLLVVVGDDSKLIYRSLRNLSFAMVVNALELNALHVATADTIILTKEALKTLETRLEAKTKATPSPAKKTTASAAKPAAKKTTKSAKPVTTKKKQ